MILNEYEDEETIEITNFILLNEQYCKKLLGIFLDTKSENVVEKYFEVFEVLRERGHFDPTIKGGSYSWNWNAFVFGPFFFWYRKQYTYMAMVVFAMFFFFFPGLILAGVVANMPILNTFALAVAKGIDQIRLNPNASSVIKQVFANYEKDKDEQKLMNNLIEVASPYIEHECKKRGGTDSRAYIIPGALLGFLIILFNR